MLQGSWPPQAIAAAISAAAAALTAIVKGAKWGWDVYQDRRLQRSIGPDVSDPEAIRQAVRYYVEPNCTSVDPAQEAEPKALVVAEEPVMRVLDRFLAEGAPSRHMVVLADSGMGKSSLLLSYYVRNQRRQASRRYRIALVHLGLPKADERIGEIAERSKTALFLDAFDEDTEAITDHRTRISELLQLTIGFRRVLLTSRTQFFPTDEEIPQDTGLLKTGSRGMEAGTYEFRKLYLTPFNDQMVGKYLRKRYPGLRLGSRRKAWALVRKVPLLSVRPMLLTHLPDLIDSKRQLASAYEIYNELVEKWYEREAPLVSKSALENFSVRLAVDLFVNREERNSERIATNELSPLASKWGIPLEDWQLRGRSLLNRDALGNYKFSHRSIMEFLIAKVLCEGLIVRTRWPDEVASLQAYLTEHALRTHDHLKPLFAYQDVLRSDGLTDQIQTFLHEFVDVLRPSSLPTWDYDLDSIQRFISRARTRAEKISREFLTKRAAKVIKLVIGPPVYRRPDYQRLSDRCEMISVWDHNAQLDWKFFFSQPPKERSHYGEATELIEKFLQKGWKDPTWIRRLIASDWARSQFLEAREQFTAKDIRKIADSVDLQEVTKSILGNFPLKPNIAATVLVRRRKAYQYC